MAEQFNSYPNFTITVSHFVRRGKEQVFEAALKQVIQQAKSFSDYIGIQLIRPTNKFQNEYLLLVRFDNQENWMTLGYYL
ncbi:MAG: hypothetical protein AAFO07_17330 [Bacteroidota bacterium]